MRLFTLLAGYAAGLAVAMKVRHDAGQSKLDSTDPNKTTLDKIVDEVKDIHQSTYADVKKFVVNHFDDVHDFESLKVKVSSIVDNVSAEAEAFITSLQEKWEMKKEVVVNKVDEFFEEKEALLDEAKNKWADFTDTTTDVFVTWIDAAKARLLSLRDGIKEKLETEEQSPENAEITPEQKTSSKKKPAPKK